jgi:hypothetical protein
VFDEKEVAMKSKLLASAMGMVLLGASALAFADDGRRHGHDRGPSYHSRHDHARHGKPAPRHWSHGQRHWKAHQHGHWHGPALRHPGRHAPYYRHYGNAPRHYGRYDDGVTIIFKGRFD